MNLKKKLKERINIKDVKELLHTIEENNSMEELYALIFDSDIRISFQALWVCSHLSESGHQWLHQKQEVLIDATLSCTHSGKRRLLLDLLLHQPMPNPPRVDLLDFCMKQMISKHEPPGVQALCMKLSYEICRPIPEILQELSTMLDIMQTELLPPSMRATRKNILKALVKQKSLRK